MSKTLKTLVGFGAAVLLVVYIGSTAFGTGERWQGLVLHVPKNGEGIVTGASHVFPTELGCKQWLASVKVRMQPMDSPYSLTTTLGTCYGL